MASKKGHSMNDMGKDESLMQNTVVRFVKGTTVGFVVSAML